MQSIDIPNLGKELNALAEVFDKKPLTERAVKVWFDTLRDFPAELVLSLLIAWPKTHTKFPAPAEVWKATNDWSIEQRERKALVERQAPTFYPGVGGAKAEEFIRQIRATLNTPKWTPTEHWQRIYARQKPGSIGHQFAEAVLRKKGLIRDREPGEDDEKSAVNF